MLVCYQFLILPIPVKFYFDANERKKEEEEEEEKLIFYLTLITMQDWLRVLSGFREMAAAGFAPASLPSLRSGESGLGFAKSVDFTKVAFAADSRKIVSISRRTKAPSITNSAGSGSDTVELEPASQGSPLLGIHFSTNMFVFNL